MHVFCIVILLIFFTSKSFSEVTIGFNTPISKRKTTDSVPCEKMVLNTIDNLIENKSKKCTMKIVMYSLDKLSILEKLIEAIKEGIKVQILLDKEQNFQTNQRISDGTQDRFLQRIRLDTLEARKKLIYDYGAVTFVGKAFDQSHYKQTRTLHDKFSIYTCEEESPDTVILGSYNWTKAASEINYESCIKIQNEPDIAKTFSNRFKFIRGQEVSISDYFKTGRPPSTSTTSAPSRASPAAGHNHEYEEEDEDEKDLTATAQEFAIFNAKRRKKF